MLLPNQWLLNISDPELAPVAACAIAGDLQAHMACYDWILEHEPHMTPFEVGKKYLICTVTLYYVGEVAEASLGWLRLKDASWVHWTGRLSVLLKRQDFTKVAGRKPRTEVCGEAIISSASIVSAYPWEGPLPKESIQ